VILGLGLVGQLALRFARWAGAAPLIAAARTATWFEAARVGGADECVELGSRAARAPTLAADVVLEATGNAGAVTTALQAARPGGRVVLLGSSRGMTPDLDLQGSIAARGITLIGAHVSSLASNESSTGRWTRGDEAELFLELVARGRIGLSGLVTRRASPSEANAVYAGLVGEQERGLGILFDWTGPSAPTLPGTAPPYAGSAPGTPPGSPPAKGLPFAAPRSAGSSSSRRLRIGLVGCGEIAIPNASGVRDSAECQLVQAMDLDEDAARAIGQRFGVPHTTRLDVILANPAVEAVVVAVPHHLHAAIAVQAAQAGKHVIVEKPLATTLEDADAMIAACRQARVALSVLFSFRYEPYVLRARELVRAGALGSIVGTRASFSIEKPMGYWSRGYSGRATDWRGLREKSGGGVLVMNMCHTIDYLRFITDLEVERAYAEFATQNSPIEVEDIISVTLRYAGGGVGSIDASSLARGQDHLEERIWGTLGTLCLTPVPARIYTLKSVAGLHPGRWQSLGKLPKGNRVSTYFDRLAAALREGREPEVTGADGRTNLAVMLAAYAAGSAGQAMRPQGVSAS
jgi:predicted dehydrogenase